MKLLSRSDVIRLSQQSDCSKGFFVEPLLDSSQIGEVSIDLRLGYDFLVSILTRKPAIELMPSHDVGKRGIPSYFQETRRRIGDRFILYPHQIVLSSTVEYLSLPNNVYADIAVRSSYGRLGVGISTRMQPGWRGAVPLEIFNHGNTPIEMIVGSRFCQAHLYEIDGEARYMHNGAGDAARKYYGTVRPTVSRADGDADLAILHRMSETK